MKLCPISGDILSEEAILKWFRESHSQKGKSVFLEQMKKFIEWLENAEEGRQIFFLFLTPLPYGWFLKITVICPKL